MNSINTKNKKLKQQNILEDDVNSEGPIYETEPLPSQQSDEHENSEQSVQPSYPLKSIRPSVQSIVKVSSVQTRPFRFNQPKSKLRFNQPKRKKSLIATCSYCGGDVHFVRNPIIKEIFICHNCGRKGHIKYFGGKPVLKW